MEALTVRAVMNRRSCKGALEKLMHYDSYERHKAVELLLGKASCDLVLDVGGQTGVLARFCTQAPVIALNVDTSGDVRYAGEVFPFGSRAFDAVVSLDTLEHLPRKLRMSFVSECIRVAKTFVLIAAPVGTPAHAAYEERIDGLYYRVYGVFNRWLHEHIFYGLPTATDLIEFKRLMEREQLYVKILYAGDFEKQCRALEWSLLLSQYIGMPQRLSSWFDLLMSLALWRKLSFSENPYAVANRFYMLGQRMEPGLDDCCDLMPVDSCR